mmetsp:Transcript_32679/g.90201  ORF Transcript_32679/g.90201 Transcript_32679/m.90201 type:complete len:234 (-) Transcript_32679:518-1219(-)
MAGQPRDLASRSKMAEIMGTAGTIPQAETTPMISSMLSCQAHVAMNGTSGASDPNDSPRKVTPKHTSGAAKLGAASTIAPTTVPIRAYGKDAAEKRTPTPTVEAPSTCDSNGASVGSRNPRPTMDKKAFAAIARADSDHHGDKPGVLVSRPLRVCTAPSFSSFSTFTAHFAVARAATSSNGNRPNAMQAAATKGAAKPPAVKNAAPIDGPTEKPIPIAVSDAPMRTPRFSGLA